MNDMNHVWILFVEDEENVFDADPSFFCGVWEEDKEDEAKKEMEKLKAKHPNLFYWIEKKPLNTCEAE